MQDYIVKTPFFYNGDLQDVGAVLSLSDAEAKYIRQNLSLAPSAEEAAASAAAAEVAAVEVEADPELKSTRKRAV